MKKVLCKIMGCIAFLSFLYTLYCVAGIEQMAEGFTFGRFFSSLAVFCASGWILNRLYEED